MRLRLANIAVAAAALAMQPAPASAAEITASVKANVVKPLVLRSVRDFDLGTLLLGPGTWSGATVRLSRTGVLTCPSIVTCSGTTQTAVYNVAGSNRETVVINAPDVTLVNQTDPSRTLTLVVDSPATVALLNSGSPGIDFAIGGAITLDSTTVSGQYSGTLLVTAEYQ